MKRVALVIGGEERLEAAIAEALAGLGFAVGRGSLRAGPLHCPAIGEKSAVQIAVVNACAPADAWPESRAVLDHCFAWTEAVWPLLLGNGAGRIVIMVPAQKLCPRGGLPGDCAVANALQGMTKALALEGAPRGITVNLLAVAIDDGVTAQPPVGRFASDRDVTRAVAFLCADEACHITGSTVVVDGGLTMR